MLYTGVTLTNTSVTFSARWGETFIAELKRVGEGPKTDNNTSTFLQVSHDPHAKSIDWRNYDGASSAPS